MTATDDNVPLSHNQEGKDERSMNRGDDGEITIELYQHNKGVGSNHAQNMGLGSDDGSDWNWLYKCFGCKRRSGTNFERIHLGEKQEFVTNKMTESRGGGRESKSLRSSFSSDSQTMK